MSRINVLRKGSLFLIIGGLAVAITLSGCDSPVGSATETTTTLPPVPRDGVMRVLPDRFTLDMPGALLPQTTPEVQSFGFRASTAQPETLNDAIFEILDKEHSNAVLNNVFWFVIADEILSRADVEIGDDEEELDLIFDEDLASKLDEYFESIPLYELLRNSEDDFFATSEWNSYRDFMTLEFVATYSYNRSDTDIYDYSFRMLIAYEGDQLADINIFWSEDLKKSSLFGNSYADEDDDYATDNITFFALDEEEGESFYLFVEFVNETGNSLNFEEANFRVHPTLNKGAFFQGKGSKNGHVIRGVADDDGGSLQVGTNTEQYFDSSRSIIDANTDYSFEPSDFEGMDAVAMLLSSGIEIRDEFMVVLNGDND